MQGEAIKDANGRPPNIVPPRTRWEWQPWDRGSRLRPFGIAVRRQRYRDIKGEFTGGAFIHGWWSIMVMVGIGPWGFVIYRWRERWTD